MPPGSHGPSIHHSLPLPRQLCSQKAAFLHQQEKPGDWHEGWEVGVEEKETEPPCWPLSGHSPALGPWCGNDSAVVGALVPAIPVTPLACLDKVLYSHYPT